MTASVRSRKSRRRKNAIFRIHAGGRVELAVTSLGSGKAATIADLAAYNKPDREQVLYEGAKKEGKLMWYTSLTGGPNTEAPKVFEAKYPGVKMEVYRGDSDALISRILQEAQAKRYLVDTIETTFPILKVMLGVRRRKF